MRLERSETDFGAHPLALRRFNLRAGAQWSPDLKDWGIFHVFNGTAVLPWEGSKRELRTGDVVALPPGTIASLHGGRITGTQFHYFMVSLDSISGVLTWSEQQNLRMIAGKERFCVRHLSATHRVAGDLARICDPWPAENSPALRCELLRIFSGIFAKELTPPFERKADLMTAYQRVEQILGRMPEAVIMSRTAEELARRCGCSVRHFSRLFRSYCGVSMRARQVQLRLNKARQLLRESNAKVIHIAMDSGYRHLGLFNTMFKRHFGMTPGEWRKRNRVGK